MNLLFVIHMFDELDQLFNPIWMDTLFYCCNQKYSLYRHQSENLY